MSYSPLVYSLNLDDPLPASHPRETKNELEKRCWEFLTWLSGLVYKNPSKKALTVVAVSHSAYLRYLFAVIGLCNPAQKRFSNLEIRHLEINSQTLARYIVRENPFRAKMSQSDHHHQDHQTSIVPFAATIRTYPHVKPAFPLDFTKLTVNPTLHYYQISSHKLNQLYPPSQPFSLVIFPPISISSQMEANQPALAAIDQLLNLNSSSEEFFSTTTFVEEVLLNESRTQYQRDRLIEDARHVIQNVDSGEKYEAICKETIHDQNCIVFLLPSLIKQCNWNNESELIIVYDDKNVVKKSNNNVGNNCKL